jgi:hypothetical protein
MLPDQVFEHLIRAARQRHGLAQNGLSRHQSFALTHEDRPAV